MQTYAEQQRALVALERCWLDPDYDMVYGYGKPPCDDDFYNEEDFNAD